MKEQENEFFTKKYKLHEYLDKYLEYNFEKIGVTAEEYTQARTEESRNLLNRIRSRIISNSNILCNEALSILISSEELILQIKTDNTNIQRRSYIKPLSFNEDINFNLDIRSSANSYSVKPHMNSSLTMVCNLIEENDSIINIIQSGIYSGNVRLNELLVLEVNYPSGVNIGRLKNSLKQVEISIEQQEKELSILQDKKESLKYVIDFMNENKIKSESESVLKSKMILETLNPDNDEDKDEPAMITQFNDIIALEF